MSTASSQSAAAEHSEGETNLLELLKHHFGHEQFRPMQGDVVRDVIAGRDTMVIMPTGGGKSLCYQMPALVREGVTLVISPLIALMQDQVQALTNNGIAATFLNSTLDDRVAHEREQAAIAGEYDLVYMAPERLFSGRGRRLVEQLNLSLIAIDEAHCISEWGHDFRPEYRQLGEMRKRYKDVPMVALTATATPRVGDDIMAQLALRDPAHYRAGFERKNLFYEARPKQKVFDQVMRYLNDNPDHEGIIYCLSRAGCEAMAGKLKKKGVAALAYHAGLDAKVREKNQHAFVYGKARVICATIAFGMGIDKPDVRFVIHTDLPRHIEGYYQETGRAGRDGLPADCILFFSHGDRHKLERFIDEKPSAAEREHAMWQLDCMVQFAYATDCRMKPLLDYFGEQHEGKCEHCDNCRFPPKQSDATEDARKLLSAVARTEQRYGLTHVISVLCGDENDRILQREHHRLSVFGIGNNRTKAHWRRVAETLVQKGLLGQTSDDYRTTFLTEQSMPVLKGTVKVLITEPRVLKQATAKKASATTIEFDESQIDAVLFDALRELRTKLASEQNLAPYMVFGNASLKHMAIDKPTTRHAFARIVGVGDFKLDKYGDVFIEAISQHEGGE